MLKYIYSTCFIILEIILQYIFALEINKNNEINKLGREDYIMDGIWIEVSVITKSEALEPISGIFYGLGCPNVAIEDPEDLLSRDQGPLTWDFADINILEHKGNCASGQSVTQIWKVKRFSVFLGCEQRCA